MKTNLNNPKNRGVTKASITHENNTINRKISILPVYGVNFLSRCSLLTEICRFFNFFKESSKAITLIPI